MTTTTKRRITLERTYAASLEDVWDLWTTKEGLESWWGPEGFRVEVQSIDLRPGGLLHYAMIAATPEHVAFMEREGMATRQEIRITYLDVVPHVRLGYRTLADFIPGVKPYDVDTTVELRRVGERVQMTLTFDAMHEPLWTERATMGWNSELDKLGRALGSKAH